MALVAEHAAQVSAVGGATCAPASGRRKGPTRLLLRSAARRSASSASGASARRSPSGRMACGMKIRYHNRNKKNVPYPYDADPGRAGEELRRADGRDARRRGDRASWSTPRCWMRSARRATSCNIARGSVIDEPVLLRYLQEKKIAGAGLDVFARRAARAAGVLHARQRGAVPARRRAPPSKRAKRWAICQIENLRLHFAANRSRRGSSSSSEQAPPGSAGSSAAYLASSGRAASADADVHAVLPRCVVVPIATQQIPAEFVRKMLAFTYYICSVKTMFLLNVLVDIT